METTIQSLNTQIEALDKALALTTETLALQQKLQAAQSAQPSGGLPAPVAKPANRHRQAGGSNWLEVLLSALAGGIVASAIAHFLGRRRDHRVNEELPLAVSGHQRAEPVHHDSAPTLPPSAGSASPAAKARQGSTSTSTTSPGRRKKPQGGQRQVQPGRQRDRPGRNHAHLRSRPGRRRNAGPAYRGKFAEKSATMAHAARPLPARRNARRVHQTATGGTPEIQPRRASLAGS